MILKNFFKSLINRQKPEEPQFIISAPVPGGSLISAPRLRLPNTGLS
jgi:hypothetical protein